MSELDKNKINEDITNSNNIQSEEKNIIASMNNSDLLEVNATNNLEDSNNYNLIRSLVSPDESPNNLEFANKKINNEDILTENLKYNKEPYLSPSMKKKRYPLSRIDKMIINYNKIKEEFNGILSYDSRNSNKKNNKDKKISKYNYKMINQLSQLNDFLNFLIDNKNIYREKSLYTTQIKPINKIDYEKYNNYKTIQQNQQNNDYPQLDNNTKSLFSDMKKKNKNKIIKVKKLKLLIKYYKKVI